MEGGEGARTSSGKRPKIEHHVLTLLWSRKMVPGSGGAVGTEIV